LKLSTIARAIQFDDSLSPLLDDHPDVSGYNAELKSLQEPTWLSAPWLFSECYLYRLIHTFFTTSGSQFWQEYDVFRLSKNNSFANSEKATLELLAWYLSILPTLGDKAKSEDEATQKALLEEVIDISLWGNATDLSLLTSFSIEDLQSRQGKDARGAAKKNIVVDDTEKVWRLLWGLKSRATANTIDIVLDNAGFELLTDLVFAAYLLQAGYAKKITLHGKRMGWFVSDVGIQDVEDLLVALEKGSAFGSGIAQQDQENLQRVGKLWRNLFNAGQLELQVDPFWTTQHPFGRMAEVAPQLYARLSASDLVVFKGDLNYRKLTSDGMWPRTTSFREALGRLGAVSGKEGIRVLALRTCKADVCVGLEASLAERLDKEQRGVWTRNGKYAVISYWNGKE
jgi:uncharacterized protein with ATP-grasp and redox domains